MNRIFAITLLFLGLFQAALIFPQQSLSIGGYLGGGVISGNTTSKGSFSSSLFLEVEPGFYPDLSFRLSFLYHADLNSILPNTTKKYYPFTKGFSLKGITFQRIDLNFFIEEGLGILALNDRTLSGVNEWDYGVNFSLAAGFDLRDLENKGFKIGLGTEYGLTFFNNLPSYFSVYLQTQYFIF
jgi:hypothetical protein